MALMTVEELAEYLRVTKKTVYRLLERRAIPARRAGHQWRFDKSSIDKWLNQGAESKSASILVIDDDENMCSLFKDTLAESGHTVMTVNGCHEALKLVRDRDYDLVFLDLKIPGMDGAQFLHQIRLDKPNLPVTIITGYPDGDLMMRALAHGPLGVMNKPFRGSDIIAAVKNREL